MGRIFCHEDRIKNINQFSSIISLNSQKWNGGNPIFHSNLNIKKKLNKSFFFKISIIKIEINKKIEPNDWTRKYFNPIIWGLKFFLKVSKGIKDNKLISINLHVIIILFIEIPQIEETISIKVNKLFLNQEI